MTGGLEKKNFADFETKSEEPSVGCHHTLGLLSIFSPQTQTATTTMVPLTTTSLETTTVLPDTTTRPDVENTSEVEDNSSDTTPTESTQDKMDRILEQLVVVRDKMEILHEHVIDTTAAGNKTESDANLLNKISKLPLENLEPPPASTTTHDVWTNSYSFLSHVIIYLTRMRVFDNTTCGGSRHSEQIKEVMDLIVGLHTMMESVMKNNFGLKIPRVVDKLNISASCPSDHFKWADRNFMITRDSLKGLDIISNTMFAWKKNDQYQDPQSMKSQSSQNDSEKIELSILQKFDLIALGSVVGLVALVCVFAILCSRRRRGAKVSNIENIEIAHIT